MLPMKRRRLSADSMPHVVPVRAFSRRSCSGALGRRRAGLETAGDILERIDVSLLPEDEVGDEGLPADDTPPDPQEIELLRDVERNLAAVVGGTETDPKVEVILHYLRERNWLERNGAIIFSQYRTTAEWVLEALCAAFPDEPVALYAGGAASFVQRGIDRRSAARERSRHPSNRAIFGWCARLMQHVKASTFSGSAPKSMSTCHGTHRGLNSAKGECKGSARFETMSTS